MVPDFSCHGTDDVIKLTKFSDFWEDLNVL